VRGATPAAPSPMPSERPGPFATLLNLARADLASGAFAQAQSRADAVLRARVPPSIRATALVLAGDAAYGMGAYRLAAERYGEILLMDELPPEASHATLALGWAELRLGRREDARRTWMRVARQFPADPRASVALILAAELSVQAGEKVIARKLLDRVLEGHPASPDAAIARLSRSVLAMREGRTQDGTRDLRVLTQSGDPSVSNERRKLLDGLMATGAQAGPERQLLLTNRYEIESTATNGHPGVGESPAPLETTGRFERFAAPFLAGAGDPESTPRVLHGLILVAAEDKAWPEVQTLSSRLADQFPGYPPAAELLVWVAGRAVSEQQWAIVRTSYEQAIAHYRNTALAPEAQVDFAEALYRTGATAQARVELTRFMETAPRAQEAPRALYLLAEVHEALDEPREALAAYERLRRNFPRAEWTAESLLPHARLLQYAIGQQKQARALLEEIVQRAEGEALTEASFRLAQVLAAEGEHPRAVDWYMAAAYGAAQRSRWYRPALLGAGRSLVALKRTRAALVVYRNLLPSMPLGPLPRDGRPVEGLKEKVEEPEFAAEAAYDIAELLRGAGRNAEAVDMYLTATSLAPESGQAWRGLVGAIRSLVAISDWQSAAAIYQRLVDSHGDTPEILAEARNALGPERRDTSRRGR